MAIREQLVIERIESNKNLIKDCEDQITASTRAINTYKLESLDIENLDETETMLTLMLEHCKTIRMLTRKIDDIGRENEALTNFFDGKTVERKV